MQERDSEGKLCEICDGISYHKNKLCECGCKQRISIKNSHIRHRRCPTFISSHVTRWLKAQNKGKPHPQWRKDIESDAHKGLLPWNIGLTKESDMRIKKYAVALAIARKGKKRHLTEEMKENLRAKRLKQIFPIKDSLLERQGQTIMNIRGIPYSTHKAILGQPDIFIEPNTCIFLDGCYWHGCHECFGFNTRRSVQWYKDFRIKQQLELEGYRVIRVWEHDIDKFNQILDKVR